MISKKKRSSPKFRAFFSPNSDDLPKTNKRFSSTLRPTSSRPPHLKFSSCSHLSFVWGGGLFSFLEQKSASKLLKTRYFAYFSGQWGRLEQNHSSLNYQAYCGFGVKNKTQSFQELFVGGHLFVFVEYLCNRSPKIKTKNIKNFSSILAIVNHRNCLDDSPPIILGQLDPYIKPMVKLKLCPRIKPL